MLCSQKRKDKQLRLKEKMNKTNPLSAIYYMKENKGRTFLGIFMMLLATLMFLAGNYIHSTVYTFEKEFVYSDKLVWAGIQSTDEEYRDFAAFRQIVEEDEKLEYVDVTAYGFSGMRHGTVLGLLVGGWSYVFNSASDMEKVFAHLGIEGDFSNCKHNSIIISQDFANDKGIKLGDTLDHSFDENLNRTYTVDAFIDDGSFCTFYIYEDNDSLGRLYIYSDVMEGEELYSYVKKLAEGKKVQIAESERSVVLPQFYVFYALFYAVDILIAIVLAVTINSVITGQYLKRTYEFGIYRALGRSRKEVKKKVAAEILFMNIIACIVGGAAILLFTYLINELVYMKKGLHLLFFSKTGLMGFILCDMLMALPLIWSKGRLMSRADVTEF